jgi:hypothetical protein
LIDDAMEDGRLARPSREAAEECSPRRKPWGRCRKTKESPSGAKEILKQGASDFGFWVAQRFSAANPSQEMIGFSGL